MFKMIWGVFSYLSLGVVTIYWIVESILTIIKIIKTKGKCINQSFLLSDDPWVIWF